MSKKEKDPYVADLITGAFIKLLYEKPFESISISEITTAALVSRNSFYRNFSSKEDIIQKYLTAILKPWFETYGDRNPHSNAEIYGDLFKFLKDNQEFFHLLQSQNLLNLLLNLFLEFTGPKPELDNTWAYITSFISYGTYGWIVEWINRGMQESAETMTELLLKTGMK